MSRFVHWLKVAQERYQAHPHWRKLDGTPWEHDAATIAATLATEAEQASRQSAAVPEALSSQQAEGWRDIASAPKNRKVLVGYHNELGNWRTIKACYYEAETLQAGEHLDTDDEWAPEGWYEESETHDDLLPCMTPTHWQPLPAAPGAAPSAPTGERAAGLSPTLDLDALTERAAETLWEAYRTDEGSPGALPVTWAAMPDDLKRVPRLQARAALTALIGEP